MPYLLENTTSSCLMEKQNRILKLSSNYPLNLHSQQQSPKQVDLPQHTSTKAKKFTRYISPRQVKRKLAHCKSSAEQALWFCESFGLQPESLELRKQTGSPINFLSSPSHKPQHQTPALSPNDSARVQQALYVLDRFVVSERSLS